MKLCYLSGGGGTELKRMLYGEGSSILNTMWGGQNWLPFMEINRKVSIIWKDILLIQYRKPLQFSYFLDNIRFKIGDGTSISFWQDTWLDGKKLSDLFPRLFSIVQMREESLAAVLNRRNEFSAWDFQFRRRLFVWENAELMAVTNLLENLNPYTIVGVPDMLVWKATSSSYSVQSMYKMLLHRDAIPFTPDKKVLKLIWNNAAPYRIQCFGWMVQLGRIKTADFLLGLGIITEVENALCKFLLCHPAWFVWTEILNWWGVKWVTPHSISLLFQWWSSWTIKKKKKRIWDCIPLAVLWSMWKMRNEWVFQNKRLNWIELVDLIKVRVALWVKASWESNSYSINDFIYRLDSVLEAL